MRKVICIVLILVLLPLPVLGFNWEDGKQIERPHIKWGKVTKEKILSTRDHPEILLGTFMAGCWILMNTTAGKKFYKQNLKGDFQKLNKIVKEKRPVRAK